MRYHEFELGKATDILVRELFKLEEGETFVITADTESDPCVVEATSRAAFVVGAKPMVIWLASPIGVGKDADPMLPIDSLAALLKEADAWVEFNNKWLLYSTPYQTAMEENERLRHLCLVGMNTDMMTRCIGRINYPLLEEFQTQVTEMTEEAEHIKVATPAGGDVEFDNHPQEPVDSDLGYAHTPGSHMLGGQIGWAPKRSSINGTIVFDGSVTPPLGLLNEPIKLKIGDGQITKFEGRKEAKEYETWLKGFNHPQMLKLAHVCYGFNPGAKLSGNVLEDERVWGCTEWGIGHYPDAPAPSHSDGICLSSSVWLDGEQILDEGQMVDKKLNKLAVELGKEY